MNVASSQTPMAHIMAHMRMTVPPRMTPRLIFYQKRIPEEVEIEVDLLQTCCRPADLLRGMPESW